MNSTWRKRRKSRKTLGMLVSLGILGLVTACGTTGQSASSATATNTVGTSAGSHAFAPGNRPRGAGGMNPAALAKVLGISATTLQTDLKANESLVEIAAGKGISEATLIKDVQASMKTQLDARVKAGKMTAAQETQVLSRYDASVKTMVERKGVPPRPAGFAHPGQKAPSNAAPNTATKTATATAAANQTGS